MCSETNALGVKKIIQKLILFISIFFIFISNVNALTWWYLTIWYKNINTGEIKYVEKGFPYEIYDNLTQVKIDDNFKWFENWEVVCQRTDIPKRYKEYWECDNFSAYDNAENELTFKDLEFSDQKSIIIDIITDYLLIFIISIPFNFLVFFGIFYFIFKTKLKLYQYLFISMISCSILDIILSFFNFSFIQFNGNFLWIYIYWMFVVFPKSIFAIIWIINLFLYNKNKPKIDKVVKTAKIFIEK